MYMEKSGARHIKEDSVDCPFNGLGTISTHGDTRRYAFNYGNKPSLAPEIVVPACLEFIASFPGDARTISMSRLLYDSGSPGQIFKMTESSLSMAIDHMAKKEKSICLTDTAGIVQFSFQGDPMLLSHRILCDYFALRS